VTDRSTLIVYVGACALLLVSPGPAVLYIVARSIERGKLAGFVSSLGISAGSLVHVGAAALGLTAVLTSSQLAFRIVKYAGAAYLVYLGVRNLVARSDPHGAAGTVPGTSYGRIFRQGLLVNLLNPKAAMFVLAFIPQFVDPTAGPVAVQIVLLGLILIVMGVISDGAYVVLAGSLGEWLQAKPGLVPLQQKFVGIVYVGLGLLAALAGPSRK
jgi:threonine/homoserine/homoserine lactone efflux protein